MVKICFTSGLRSCPQLGRRLLGCWSCLAWSQWIIIWWRSMQKHQMQNCKSSKYRKKNKIPVSHYYPFPLPVVILGHLQQYDYDFDFDDRPDQVPPGWSVSWQERRRREGRGRSGSRWRSPSPLHSPSTPPFPQPAKRVFDSWGKWSKWIKMVNLNHGGETFIPCRELGEQRIALGLQRKEKSKQL